MAYLLFFFFGPKACGILVSRLGIEPSPPALEGKVLTTGPPGKSLDHLSLNLCCGSEVSWDSGECM